MTQPQKNTALVFGIVAGLASLPVTWMTLHNAQMEGGLGEMFNSAFGGGITLNVTALNGHVTFLVETPIWLVVGVAITANVLQLMRSSKMFAVSLAFAWLTAIVAVAGIGFIVVSALVSGKATLGVGALLGVVSAMVPLFCLAIRSSGEQISVSNSPNADA